MKLDAREPGFIVSGAAHVLILVAALVSFSRSAPFEDAQETAPVDLITNQQFNEIMKGEKTEKKVLDKPVIRAEQKSDTPEPKPHHAVAEAKRDVPAPPPRVEHVQNPGQDTQPPAQAAAAAAVPPDRPPDLTEPPAPMPPPRPDLKPAPAPIQAAQAEDAPLPPQRPKFAEAQPQKEPPLPPMDRPKPKPEAQLRPDQIAKLLARASHPREQDQRSDSERLDPTEISQLLSRDKPEERASSGRELSDVSSLGSETANAPRMSPSMWGALDGLLQDQYKKCWSYLGLDTEHRYIPQIKVEYTQDGALAADPSLINPPNDPSLQSLAESAMRAVRECNPLKIPPQFAPYFNQWKARILRFDPEEMSG